MENQIYFKVKKVLKKIDFCKLYKINTIFYIIK